MASDRAIAIRWRWPTRAGWGGGCRVGEAHFLDEPSALARALARRPAALEHRDLDILEGRERGHQIERLEDEADLVGAEVVDVELRQRLAAEVDLALGGPIEAAEQVQERALAAAAGTGDRHRFGRVDPKRDAAECLDVAVGVVLDEPLGAEDRGVGLGCVVGHS